MSISSERKAMRDLLAEYSLMDEDEGAAFTGRTSEDIWRATEAGVLPSITVGHKLRRYDLFDLVAWVLGGTPTEDALVEKARELIAAMPRSFKVEQGSRRGRIYLLETTEGPHRLKIGFSADPERRLTDLLTLSPIGIRLKMSVIGTLADERRLHARFAGHRVRGEWFEGAALVAIEAAMQELMP